MKLLSLKDLTNENIGNKAKKLLHLENEKFNIPKNNYILDSNDLSNDNYINFIDLSNLCDDKLYAVRSSAIGEDGHKNSFAGIFKSILNVEKKDILEAIKEVYDSFYSRKAIVYSQLKKTTYKPCILIQEMVQSDYSIVMFIAENKMVMNFAIGNCEQIVSGTSNTLELVLDLDDEKLEDNINYIVEQFKDKYNNLNVEDVFNNISKLKQLYGNFLDIEMTYNSTEKKWYYLQIRDLIH